MVLNNVAWIGRLTGPKGEIALFIINKVAPLFPAIRFTIVGGPVNAELKRTLPDNVQLTGFVENVNDILQKHDLVIGSGRVALEAMRLNIPVIAAGERAYIGPVTEATIDLARQTNFGDCNWLEKVNYDGMIDDIRAIASSDISIDVQNYGGYLKEYNANTVYDKIMQVYRQAIYESYLARFKEIPILTYHRVVTEPPTDSRINMYVTQAELEQQIISLQKRGYTTTTFKDIANGSQPVKPVILTFDDGYEDNYENLLPVLQKHNAKAVIFALADRTLRENKWDMEEGEPSIPLMSDAQLLECHNSGCIEIGSHGKCHQHLPAISGDALYNEVHDSKMALEELLKTEVVSFAYPYGDYGEREAESVKQAGYIFGVGTVNGPLRISDDLMKVRRITIFPGTTPLNYRKKTSGYYLRYCKLKGKDF